MSETQFTPRVFSGIQPSGDLHLGNYLGALKRFVDSQDRGIQSIYCMVDLHAIAVPQAPETLRHNTRELCAGFLASGIDPERILIAGASAGGGLAAGAALMARDRGFPALTHQVRICPMIDDRLVTQSAQCLDGEGTWDRRDNLFGWTCLLGEERGGPDVSPYAAPARATDLAGPPRT